MPQTISTADRYCKQVAVGCVHPTTQNLYIVATVQPDIAGRQDIVIWRYRPTGAVEVVRRYEGGPAGRDAPGMIGPGDAILRPDGSLVVVFSAPTAEAPDKWVPQLDIISGVDQPWGAGGALGAAPGALVPLYRGDYKTLDEVFTPVMTPETTPGLVFRLNAIKRAVTQLRDEGVKRGWFT